MNWTRAALFGALAVSLLGLVAVAPSSASVSISTPGLASVRTAGSIACPTAAAESSSVTWPYPDWRECTAGTITQSSPTVADWHHTTIVAVGDENGVVHVVNAATGAELPGWPRSAAAPAGEHGAIESSPTIAFLDGPLAPPSIIVGSGSTWVSNSVGEVEAFRLSGAVRFVYRVAAATGTAIGVISSPAVGDVTGAGSPDVVFGSWDHNLYALTASGALVRGFPIDTADTVWSSPTLYRPAGAPADDIYLGSDASGLQGCFGGWVSDYAVSAAHARLVWRHCESQSIWSSPAVGVIDSSGQAAVVVGTSFYEQPFPSGTDKLYAYYAASGRPVPGWPVTTSGPTLGSPVIGVISATGRPAVVDTSWVCAGNVQPDCFSSNRSRVSAWSGSGRALWSTALPGPTDLASPVLVPLAGHRWDDVLVGSPNGLYPIAGSSGGFLFGTSNQNQAAAINPGCRLYNSVAVADVLGNAIRSGWHVFEACGGPPPFHSPGEVVSYALPTSPATSPAWPMFRASAQHGGVAPRVQPLKVSRVTLSAHPSPASVARALTAVRAAAATTTSSTTTTVAHPAPSHGASTDNSPTTTTTVHTPSTVHTTTSIAVHVTTTTVAHPTTTTVVHRTTTTIATTTTVAHPTTTTAVTSTTLAPVTSSSTTPLATSTTTSPSTTLPRTSTTVAPAPTTT